MDKYIKAESGADQYLGRILAGLDINSIDFSLLPPHFGELAVPAADLALFFPSFVSLPSLHGVLRFALASCIYHLDQIDNALPEDHDLRFSVLFTEGTVVQRLEQQLITGVASPCLAPTGIPVHVGILRDIRDLRSVLDRFPERIVDRLESVLERNGAAAANVTPTNVRQIIDGILRELLPQYVPELRRQEPAALPPAVAPPQWFLNKGHFSRFPSDFTLPKVKLAAAWRLWHCGNPTAGFPAFKTLLPADLAGNSRKRLSDWRFIMQYLSSRLSSEEEQELSEEVTDQRLNELYVQASADLPKPKNKKKRTRPDDWALATVVREVQREVKRFKGDEGIAIDAQLVHRRSERSHEGEDSDED
jgi:hypothetical protein